MLRGPDFFISNPFSMIVSVSDVPRGGIQVLLESRNNRALPLDLNWPKCLNV
jgi:hypothetical protein